MARGIQFTNRACDIYAFHHIFDRVREENGIEHRLTKVKHPWTNGRQRAATGRSSAWNRTIKDGEAARKSIQWIDFPLSVKRLHSDDHAQPRRHLADFIDAYNFGRRLKTLSGPTPYEFICKQWTAEPERFMLNPLHQMPGLNT